MSDERHAARQVERLFQGQALKVAGPVVVILGDRPVDGMPSGEMVKRVRFGVPLAAEANALCIVFSGGVTAGNESEAELMRRIARAEFPENHIPFILEDRSLDTIGNAYFTGRLIEKTEHGGVIVATSPFHAARADYIFRHVLGEDVVTRTFGPPPEGPSDSEEEAFELARFMLDDLKPMDLDELWSRMKTIHPYYSGSVTGG